MPLTKIVQLTSGSMRLQKPAVFSAHYPGVRPQGVQMPEVEYKMCPVCDCKLRASRYRKHMDAQHSPEAERRKADLKTAQQESARVKKEFNKQKIDCPKCNSKVIRKNLNKHLLKIHGIKAVNNFKSKRFSVVNQSKAEIAHEILEALKETNMIKNKEISRYLQRNPDKEELGKYGVPQDKYRYGFYGSHSMEYDAWGKGEKKK